MGFIGAVVLCRFISSFPHHRRCCCCSVSTFHFAIEKNLLFGSVLWGERAGEETRSGTEDTFHSIDRPTNSNQRKNKTTLARSQAEGGRHELKSNSHTGEQSRDRVIDLLWIKLCKSRLRSRCRFGSFFFLSALLSALLPLLSYATLTLLAESVSSNRTSGWCHFFSASILSRFFSSLSPYIFIILLWLPARARFDWQ